MKRTLLLLFTALLTVVLAVPAAASEPAPDEEPFSLQPLALTSAGSTPASMSACTWAAV